MRNRDDPDAVREPARDDRHEHLRDLPTELRGEVRSFYDGAMEADGFARRLRSIANELDRHADAITDREQAPPFPEFAARRAKRRQYSVERESRTGHDGQHIMTSESTATRRRPPTSSRSTLFRGWTARPASILAPVARSNSTSCSATSRISAATPEAGFETVGRCKHRDAVTVEDRTAEDREAGQQGFDAFNGIKEDRDL